MGEGVEEVEGVKGGGDRERKGSRERDRERDRGRDRDGDNRRGQRGERERDGGRSSRERELRERERERDDRNDRDERNDRRVNTSRPPTRQSSPSGSRSPDSRDRYSSESARERDRKDRTRSFDETLTRRGRDEPQDRPQRDSQNDRTKERDRREVDRDERRRKDERPGERSDKREAIPTVKEEEGYERRRKDSDQAGGSNQVSPVPHSPASAIPASSSSPSSSTSSSTSSVDEQCGAKARAYKRRADSMKSADSVEMKREKAFLYTVAGILFFLAAHRKKPSPSSTSSAPTSYKEFFDFLHSNQKVINDSALYSLSQVSHRAKAICALQHSLAYLDNAGCKKTAKRLVGELKEHSQPKATPPSDFLTASRCQELLQMAECVDLQCTAREQWKLAAALNFVSERPFPSYGLYEEVVERNSVKGVVEYCRKTLMDLVDRKEVVLSSPVDLEALDVDWKGDK